MSEPARSNRRTKERFVNIPGAVIYVIKTWANTKILKENKIDIPSFKDFHAQLDCKLTYGNKNQTQPALVKYIKFRVQKQKRTKQK